MNYKHLNIDESECPLPVGKVVCVARNYYAHIKELNNPVPTEPIFFIKPATALQTITDEIVIPSYSNNCHHETELAVLIGKKLSKADLDSAKDAIAGYGIALDLTLRDVQQKMKEKGYPWEVAKAFDGSCPISPFISSDVFQKNQSDHLHLFQNFCPYRFQNAR